jgi:glycosyltransferase involved in cell wall biosynthesis
MKKIKILYTIPNFDTAGSGKVLYDLANGLDKEKFEVAIACTHNGGVFFKEIEALGHQIHIIQTTVHTKPYFSLLSRIRPFKDFLVAHDIDLVHSWNWSSDWTEIIATRWAGKKFIFTKKAMTWGNIHWKIRSHFSNFIVTINNEMENFFPNKKNQKLIPIGLDTDYYNPDLFEKKPDDGVFKIITVANLVAVKAIERIITAIDYLKNPNIYFEIIGDRQTDYAKSLKQMVVDLKLEQQIIFLGKHTDVRPFVSQADLYIICSKNEGMPMALVEAMTMAVPVLGSNISGVNYVLKNFPELLFDTNIENALAQKINWMLQKPKAERTAIGKGLRKFCVDNFSTRSFITSHQNLYTALMTNQTAVTHFVKDLKTKILFTIPNFDTAGSGKVLYDLANGLDKTKFDVEIACVHNKGSFFTEVEKLHLPVHFIDTTIPFKPYFSLFLRLKPIVKFLKTNKYDIVHSWHWSSDWTEVFATRMAGAKFIYTKKAMSWGNIHWKIKSRFSNFIVTINDDIIKFFPNKLEQELIPLGIDTDYYNKKHFPTRQTSTDFKIITVANLVPVKGIEILIKAIHLLQNPNLKLEIVGDTRDPYAEILKQMVADLQLEAQINFLGKNTDVRPFLADSDLFVIPTLNEGRKEGMPMALVEAMCMGIPVLGSNISGINYVLKDFPSLLFEAKNESDLSHKINKIYTKTPTERIIIGNDLEKHCQNHFAIQKFIDKHQELYNKVKIKTSIFLSFVFFNIDYIISCFKDPID